MSSSNSHLTFPTPSVPDSEPAPKPRTLSKNRLYVGNLHPTVDEYTLLRLFSKYGKVKNLDFLFHKLGPSKGKPRGFAFVEYSDQQEAHRALSTAHDKLLRGRKLVVTFAHQAPPDADGSSKGGATKRRIQDGSRSTTLSLLKGVSSSGATGTQDKIAALEAKLQQLEQSKAPDSIASTETPHPSSLPSKPSSFPIPTSMPTRKAALHLHARSTVLPPLPISPQKPKEASPSTVVKDSQPSASSQLPSSNPRKFATTSLKGVRIKGKNGGDLQGSRQDGAVDPSA